MRRKLAIALLILLGLVVVAVAAGAGFVWWEARSVVHELHAGPKAKIVKAVEPVLKQKPKRTLVKPPPPVAGEETILLIGPTTATAASARWTRPSSSASTRSTTGRWLSIPRDLYVEIPGHGHDRINMAEWAFGKGAADGDRPRHAGVKMTTLSRLPAPEGRPRPRRGQPPIHQRYQPEPAHAWDELRRDRGKPAYQKLNGAVALRPPVAALRLTLPRCTPAARDPRGDARDAGPQAEPARMTTRAGFRRRTRPYRQHA
jgi:hypothetical protein